uniref:Unkown protein n=1 Tax=Riptortus pedestris TaxID=329032 RepID=R4WD66_RIPPE|nr:unkown protein [Riptortus pedestris]
MELGVFEDWSVALLVHSIVVQRNCYKKFKVLIQNIPLCEAMLDMIVCKLCTNISKDCSTCVVKTERTLKLLALKIISRIVISKIYFLRKFRIIHSPLFLCSSI